MENFFLYSLKAGVCLSVFYSIYYFFLSRDTAYGRNRAYLVSAILLAISIPLLSLPFISIFQLNNGGRGLSQIAVSLTGAELAGEQVQSETFPALRFLSIVYIVGLLLFCVNLMLGLIRLLKLIRRSKLSGRIVWYEGINISGFSALGLVFINSRLTGENLDKVIRHENIHNSKLHFIDAILLEVLTVFQWMNPFIYMVRYSLRAVHEYQADRELIRESGDIQNYQQLLLNEVFGSGKFAMVSSFSTNSLLKKRFIMMTKKETNRASATKLLLAVPALVLMVGLFSCNQESTDSAELIPEEVTPVEAVKVVEAEKQSDIFQVVEEMPTFQGGDITNFSTWVRTRVKYPVVAQQNGIQGRVFIGFVVEPDGSVSNVTLLRSVDKSLDDEAIRVVQSSPKWEPGKQRGENVRVRFSITVNFALN